MMCKMVMVMRSDVLSGFESVALRKGQEEELVRLGGMGNVFVKVGMMLFGGGSRGYS